MLHPVLIVSFWVIFAGVGTARFFAVDGGFGGLYTSEN